MSADPVYVFTARFNPLRWKTPHKHFEDWAKATLDHGARVVVAEVQYGGAPFLCADIPHVQHIGLRADSWAWSKENAIMEAIRRTPQAQKIVWEDADVFHRNPNWVSETSAYLEHYRVLQTWENAMDLGPNDELIALHRSFADCFLHGSKLAPGGPSFWKADGGPYDYPHSGFSWGCTRAFLDYVGGLFELGGMGSADHHMALAIAGLVESSWPGGTSASYKAHLLRWQDRTRRFVNGHGFDPDTDLKRNSWGILEWAGNKPELEREWDLYLRSRAEDENCL
jgi:hypothetical protein